jgi:hypothetical protein
MMNTTQPQHSPFDTRTVATGFGIGLGILAFFVLLGLAIHQTMSVQFGVPYQ